MFTRKIAASVATAALALSAMAALPAQAANDQTITIKVSTAGVDLTDPAGVRVVLARIHRAAEAICGEKPDARLLGEMPAYDTCVARTVSQAVRSSHALSTAQLGGGEFVEASR